MTLTVEITKAELEKQMKIINGNIARLLSEAIEDVYVVPVSDILKNSCFENTCRDCGFILREDPCLSKILI